MGIRINMEKRIDDIDHRLKLVEDAMEELIQTRVHHVDLHDEMDKHEKSIRAEGVELKPDEEYVLPVGKRKKTTHKKTVSA